WHAWTAPLPDDGPTPYRPDASRLKAPTGCRCLVRLSWLGSSVFDTDVEELLKRRPTPLGTPLTVSPGFVMTFLANVSGLAACSLRALRKTSLPVICFSSPMAQISRASLRRAPVRVTSNIPKSETT